MSKFLESIKSIEFDKNTNRIKGIKSAILWAHDKDGNGAYPLVYISKPGSMSEEDFDEVINNLHINIRYAQ